MTLTLKRSRVSFRKACPGSVWPEPGQGEGSCCPRGVGFGGGPLAAACLSQGAPSGLAPAPGMSPDPLPPMRLVRSGR